MQRVIVQEISKMSPWFTGVVAAGVLPVRMRSTVNIESVRLVWRSMSIRIPRVRRLIPSPGTPGEG